MPEKNIECKILDDRTLESYDYGGRVHGDVFEILATSFLATGTGATWICLPKHGHVLCFISCNTRQLLTGSDLRDSGTNSSLKYIKPPPPGWRTAWKG